MHARIFFALATVAMLVLSACASTQPEPTPSATAPMNRDGGPHVDQGAPNAGGVLFNGN